MKAFCFSLTILCAVQSILAIPRPDFGINGDVTNKQQVLLNVDLMESAFLQAGEKSVTIVSGYDTLQTLANTLQTIGGTIASKGGDVALKLSFLANDNDGPVDTVFTAVFDKIEALDQYLNTGAAPLLTLIQDLAGPWIPAQFNDMFSTMQSRIPNLLAALQTLRQNMNAAKAAAGSSATVSAAIIKKFVPPKSVSDVNNFIRLLRETIPGTIYVINSSLGLVELADEFIVDITQAAENVSEDYDTTVDSFQLVLDDEASELFDTVVDAMGFDLETVLLDIMPDLEQLPGYSTGLGLAIGALNALYSVSLPALEFAISTHYDSYKNAVPPLIQGLDTELGVRFCAPIKAVTEALISNGPWANFCFSKFSPQAYGQVSMTVFLLDVCFEQELYRIFILREIIVGIVVQVLYNFEDIVANLSVCLSIPSPDNLQCIGVITPHYVELGLQSVAHFETSYDLLEAETKASLQRLGACLVTSTYGLEASGIAISTGVEQCVQNGPNA